MSEKLKVGIFYHRARRMGDRGVLTNLWMKQHISILMKIEMVKIMTIDFQICIFCSLTCSCYSHKMIYTPILVSGCDELAF
jgi:hypothetical protein